MMKKCFKVDLIKRAWLATLSCKDPNNVFSVWEYLGNNMKETRGEKKGVKLRFIWYNFCKIILVIFILNL
jgi:hypothetical protein